MLLFICFPVYPGFVWDRVNFLLSVWYSAVFWIWDENNVDNARVFWLLSRAYSASQGLSSAPCCATEGCTRSCEGAEPGQLAQTGQRSIPYYGTSCSGYKWGNWLITAWDRDGHQSESAEQIALCVTSFSWV